MTLRVLVVKTSSLGDVIHILPALTDAARALPGISFDWVVEEAFAEIPAWHPAVNNVIPVAMRRWRRNLFSARTRHEWQAYKEALRATEYDIVIDAQGLLKSAWLARRARGPLHGLDQASAREPLASLFYARRHAVPWGHHAVRRVRELFAATLGYSLPDDALTRDDGAATADAATYGLDRSRVLARVLTGGIASRTGLDRSLILLHGTTWVSKHWPEQYWRTLAERAIAAGWHVSLPWGNVAERERAERISSGLAGANVLPQLSLAGIAAELARATACVAVDTGLGHLAAALDVPTLSLFGPTNPAYTGAWGRRQVRLASDLACAPCLKKTCARHASATDITPPCFGQLPPDRVWETLTAMVAGEEAQDIIPFINHW